MKKILSILLIVIFFFSLASFSFAQTIKQAELAVLEKDEVINSDYFITGEKVIVSGTVNGDVYAAGGNVIVDGTVNGDLFAAGGNVEVTGEINGNVRTAGGNVQIEGSIDKNITALGGSVRVDKDARVLGSLVSAGGTININSALGKGLVVAGGDVNIADSIGGDVIGAVGQLSLGDRAAINGDLTYLSEKVLLMSEGSTVSGAITHNVPEKEKGGPGPADIKFGFTVFSFLTSMLIGSLLLYFLPRFTQRVSNQISQKPIASFFAGLLFLIIVPVIAVFLMVTLIGIPLGIVLFVSYIFVLFFGHIFTGLALGRWASKRLNFSQNSYFLLAFGLLILAALRFIPVLGWFISFVTVMLGVGGYITIKKEVFLNLRAKKLL